jgi:hypothetical protein
MILLLFSGKNTIFLAANFWNGKVSDNVYLIDIPIKKKRIFAALFLEYLIVTFNGIFR